MWTRSLRTLNVRGARRMGSSAPGAKPAYVAMPETAMITNNGTHRFERKGWEYSTYMGIFGGPVVLYLGLSNAPETDSEVTARAEAFAKRRGEGQVQFNVTKRPTGPISSQYVYERTEIGERPSLQA
ncbi:hypothetical protein PINS_up015378 [Pythium insidiosum]|nr:hypothetical protein PINS_up015378 [Pythium insidiosum]